MKTTTHAFYSNYRDEMAENRRVLALYNLNNQDTSMDPVVR